MSINLNDYRSIQIFCRDNLYERRNGLFVLQVTGHRNSRAF